MYNIHQNLAHAAAASNECKALAKVLSHVRSVRVGDMRQMALHCLELIREEEGR